MDTNTEGAAGSATAQEGQAQTSAAAASADNQDNANSASVDGAAAAAPAGADAKDAADAASTAGAASSAQPGTKSTDAGATADTGEQSGEPESAISRYLGVAERAFDQVGHAIEEGVQTGENAFDMAYRFAAAELEHAEEIIDHDLLHGALTQQQLKQQQETTA